MSEAVPLVRVVRSGFEEAVHLGHVAVSDGAGRLVASAGAPDTVVLSRSCLKPLQAAASLAHVPDDLDDRLIAVMCGSHTGEQVHVGLVRDLLAEAGLSVEDLRCPPAWPWHAEDVAGVAGPAPEYHNCSGKHAGMLLASARAGRSTADYLHAEHPLQGEIRELVRDVAGVDAPPAAVDGCGAPNHGLPLSRLAASFATMPHDPRFERPLRAMRAHPYLVGGRGRLDSTLMERADVVAKGGAEGLAVALSRSSGLAVAVKIADGAARAAGPALVHALGLLGVLDEGETKLRELARPPVLGGGGAMGELVPNFGLRTS